MKKIIFLDIDGVLATEYAKAEKDDRVSFEPHLTENLNTLIQETDAQIVISSTWRIRDNVESLRDIFILRNFKFPDSIIDVTPRGCKDCYRGNEIQSWIKDNISYDKIDEYKFCIIDDDSDMLYWHKDFFVHTNGREGLTVEKMKEAIGVLNG